MSPLLNPQKARPPTQKTAGPQFLVRGHGWPPAFVAFNGCRRRMLWRRLGRRLAPAGKQFLVRIGPPHKNTTKGRTPKPGVRHPCVRMTGARKVLKQKYLRPRSMAQGHPCYPTGRGPGAEPLAAVRRPPGCLTPALSCMKKGAGGSRGAAVREKCRRGIRNRRGWLCLICC